MGFTTIKSTQLNASGAVVAGSARVKSIYYDNGSSNVGTIQLRNGGASGTVVCTINTPGAVDQYQVDIPEPGIRCESSSGPYIAVTGGVSFVTVFYD